MNIRRGWKVVHYSERLQEYTSAVQVGEAEIVYSSEWVKPNKGCGPLCIFASAENAEKYRQDMKEWYSNLKVVECEYVCSDMDMVWDEGETLYLCELPPGTILADRVRLIL